MTQAVAVPVSRSVETNSSELVPTERSYVWCGVAAMVLVLVGLLVAHLLPPPSPHEGASQIAAFYRAHANGLRWGTLIMGFGAALMAPWMGVVTKRLRTIEGHGPASAYCTLALGALLVFEIVLPITVGQVVAFRPDRPASETLALSDLFLILLISPAYTFIVELLVTAVAILADRGARRAFPRWTGWVNLATVVLSVPGVTVIFFKGGPWRWSGLLGFWVPAVVFGIWMISMTIGLLSASQRDAS